MDISEVDISKLLKELSDIGVALSAEKDHERLMEMILLRAMDITNADGGTLYLMDETNKELMFEIMHNHSLKLHQGGKSSKPIQFYPIPLYDEDEKPNYVNVAACVALNSEVLNIKDAYEDEQFDFSGTRKFDSKMSYRSQSFLTVPLCKDKDEVIGVLQLINAIDRKTNMVKEFSVLDQQLVGSLASQAAVAITNKNLLESQKNLFDAFIKLIAVAIDEKSPHTGEHCLRVPVITNMLARAVCDIDKGPFKDFNMTDEEIYELDVAAWLHDCGKITTPEYVVDKSTKLETIYDRIELVNLRYEILIRDARIKALLRTSENDGFEAKEDLQYQQEVDRLLKQRDFIQKTNVGGEYLSEEDKLSIENIAETSITYSDNNTKPLLSDEEINNLQISRGTLTLREREIIHNHVSVTIKMLESLPYPKHLERVPEYAGGHHERMDGTGYPNGLTQEQMSVPARMLAIADVFEALTSVSRPYKKGMKLSQALSILGRMKQDNHVDSQLFDVFIDQKVYLKFAEEYLNPEQIDEVDLNNLPGYSPIV